MRARQIPFASDPHALTSSRIELRKQFLANAHLTDPLIINELLVGITEVEDMLLNGLVQGKVVEEPSGDVKVRVDIRKENAESMNPEVPNPLEHLGDGLFPEKTLDDVVLDTHKPN
jgi:hypothetical protein